MAISIYFIFHYGNIHLTHYHLGSTVFVRFVPSSTVLHTCIIYIFLLVYFFILTFTVLIVDDSSVLAGTLVVDNKIFFFFNRSSVAGFFAAAVFERGVAGVERVQATVVAGTRIMCI